MPSLIPLELTMREGAGPIEQWYRTGKPVSNGLGVNAPLGVRNSPAGWGRSHDGECGDGASPGLLS